MSLVEMYMKKRMEGNYSLGQMFIDCVSRKPPDGTFQIDGATGEIETNASVLARSVRLARCFRRLGVQPGDVLALGGPNHLDLHIPYYAALMNGLPIVGVDPYFKHDEIKSLFKLTEPKIAFCQLETKAMYAQVAKELALDIKIFTFDGDEDTMAKLLDKYEDGQSIEEFQPAIFDTEKVYAWLVSTSGTTGLAKVAAFNHNTLITKILQYVQMVKVAGTPGPKLNFNVSPVQWISGYFNAIAMLFMDQIKLQTSRADDIGHMIDVINEYKPHSIMPSPCTMAYVLKHEKHCDLTCFDTINVSGSKIYKTFLNDLKSRMNPRALVVEAYGQTETVGPLLMPHPRGPLGCCGRPMPGVAIKLVDPNTGEEITEPHVAGELWSKGAAMFTEYYNNPEATAQAFTEDGWYKTGDLLRRDENHNYFYEDRLKLLIKYKNHLVVPLEIEELIASHEGVLEVSVTSVPDADDCDLTVACVVRSPASDVSAQEIKHLVASKLSSFKQLHGGVIFLEKLPKTSTGKVARKHLQQIVLHANRI